MNIAKDLYNYRELLKTSITKDVGGKYKHSFLGVIWSFVNPLLQIAVYALVFQVILKSNIENYAVYLCCGLVPWQYFSSVVLRGAATIIDNGNIIKKVYFRFCNIWRNRPILEHIVVFFNTSNTNYCFYRYSIYSF